MFQARSLKQTPTETVLMLIVIGFFSLAQLSPGQIITQTGNDVMLTGNDAINYQMGGNRCIVVQKTKITPPGTEVDECKCVDIQDRTNHGLIGYGKDQQGRQWYRLHFKDLEASAGLCPVKGFNCQNYAGTWAAPGHDAKTPAGASFGRVAITIAAVVAALAFSGVDHNLGARYGFRDQLALFLSND